MSRSASYKTLIISLFSNSSQPRASTFLVYFIYLLSFSKISFSSLIKLHKMICTKKLIKLARKWRRIAAASRKRISWPRPVANEGHFVVYTVDGKRFMIPLACLKSEIFIELLQIAEEEFGVASSGPIMLPCDSNFMEYALAMIRRGVAVELEKALIMSLATCRYSSLSREHQQQTESHFICSY